MGIWALVGAADANAARGVPRLSTIDHPGDAQGLFFDPGVIFGDGFDIGVRFGMRAEYHISPGAGLAFDVAGTHVNADDTDETAIGNLGLWGFFGTGTRGGTRLIGRLGVTIGTAPSSTSASANLVGYRIKVQDLTLAMPDAFALRLGGSALDRSGSWFWRADGGLDIFLSNTGDRLDPIAHLGAAFGYDARSVAFALELANALALEERFVGDELLHTLALTANFPAGWYASIVLPLDDPGDLWAITAGLYALSF